jgi:hypothetical protein
MSRPQCTHGINDDTDLTFRHTVEDFVRGVKVTVYGFWCKEHDRHGTWRLESEVKKLELPQEIEP